MGNVKVLLVGANGRLGSLIQKLEKTTAKLEFAGMIGRRNSAEFESRLANSTVVLDVSEPEATLDYFARLQKANRVLPYVIGCTGWKDEQLAAAHEYAKSAPLVIAPNFSPTISILIDTLERIAPTMKKLGYAVAIKETHHEKKADSPSGTAKYIAETLIQKGFHPKMESSREGQVIGRHEIHFTGSYDHLSFVHDATDRILFAQGAIIAARWASENRPAGLYSMRDVLKDPH